MKICILGYGKMGKEIEHQSGQMNIEISKIIDNKDNIENTTFDKDEIVIDFTNAHAFLKNFPILAKKKVNIICGTTGWLENEKKIINIIEKENIGFLHSSNFSIGVNIFFKIINNASSMINKLDNYDIICNESHHKNKKDSPSGTAIEMANIILNNVDRKNKLLVNNPDREMRSNEINLACSRGGHIFGNHNVIFDSEIDTIKISHNAKNRAGFAKGAIQAAYWLINKKGYLTREDWLNDLIKL